MRTLPLAEFAKPNAKSERRLDWTTMESCLAEPEVASMVARGSRQVDGVLFNLEGFDFLNSDGLMWLLLLATHLTTVKQVPAFLEVPRKESARSVLLDFGFFEASLGSLGLLDMPIGPVQQSGKRSRIMRRFHKVDASTFQRVATDLGHYFGFGSGQFAKDMGFGQAGEEATLYGQDFYFALFQLAQNVVRHAEGNGRPSTGYLIVDDRQPGRIRICLGDVGQGFPASFSTKRAEPFTAVQAIGEALLHRYHNLPESAEGIFRVLASVHRWGGYFRVMSDGAKWQAKLERGPLNDEALTQAVRRHAVVSATPFPGVQYFIEFELGKRRRNR